MKLQAYVMMVLMLLVTTLSSAAEDKAESKPESSKPKKAVEVVKVEKTEKAEAEKSIFKNDMDKVSYTIGSNIGRSMKSQNLDLNLDLFVKGLSDSLAGRELALTQPQMEQAMIALSLLIVRY